MLIFTEVARIVSEPLLRSVWSRSWWRNQPRQSQACAWLTADSEYRSGVCPKRTRVVALYAQPPAGATVLCLDELGPVTPRAVPPPAGWSPDGHRIKVLLAYGRGPEKRWVYGALRVRDGQAVTRTAPSRNTSGYLALLEEVAEANPVGELYLITDNRSSHKSPPIQTWLMANPRVQQVFLPVGACWLNLIEAWWRLFRREALAGQDLGDAHDVAVTTRAATGRLNRRATPWVWGRPPRPLRQLRRRFVYRL